MVSHFTEVHAFHLPGRRVSQTSTVYSGADLEVFPVIENEQDKESVEVHCLNRDVKFCHMT